MEPDSHHLSPLITLARQGDKPAFLELLIENEYEQMIREVGRTYLSELPSYDEERLFRELMVYLWQAIRYESPVRRDAFENWLQRTTRDNCRFIRFRLHFLNGNAAEFDRYEILLRRFIWKHFPKIPQKGYEDDAIQDITLRVINALPEFRKNAEAFQRFLYKTTRGCCQKIIDKCIERFTTLETLSDVSQPESEDMDQEDAQWLQQAVRSLPEEFRKPLVLKSFLECKHREIAHILDIPQGTSQVRCLRGKKHLKSALKRSRQADMLPQEPHYRIDSHIL